MFPINYIEPVFRPPSEANSLILPVTNGCSWNNCSFCEMYTAPQKKFRARKEEDVLKEIRQASQAVEGVQKVFLADGDATVLPIRRLVTILQALKSEFKGLRRISSYCLPRNLKKKSVEDLRELKQAGLDLVYVGVESGDDEILRRINKGETFKSSTEALLKLKAAGIKSSVMVLNGLGGRKFTEQHAINSARALNETQPEFVSTLVVTFPTGEQRFREVFGDNYEPLTQKELFEEMLMFLEATELKNSIFRSDHASNYLVLKGNLGRDKSRMIEQVNKAIHQPNKIHLRQEWQRGL